MESIEHRFVHTNGIKMHIAEKGSGPLVLLLHGFPEMWYSWRHQILDLAENGYHAVAPDLRGYGDTDVPKAVENYTCFHVVGDLIGLLDALNQDKVYIVAHDWGALMAWCFALFRPDRVKAMVILSIPYSPRPPGLSPITLLKALVGDSFYICRFQEPGVTEAEMEKYDTETNIRGMLASRKPGAPIIPPGMAPGSSPTPVTLPDWLSEEDVRVYSEKFHKNGFTGPLNYYRNIDRNWELMAPWTGSKVYVQTKFITGDMDITYTTPGGKELIHGGFKKNVPFLQEVVVLENTGHFMTLERPKEISKHILDFIKNY